MIIKLIEEINTALSHNLYFAALSLALTLPDICGKAEYPNKGSTIRYRAYREIQKISSHGWSAGHALFEWGNCI